jgi:hypothetical protein
MIDRGVQLAVKRQAELLDLSRSNVYYTPRPAWALSPELGDRSENQNIGVGMFPQSTCGAGASNPLTCRVSVLTLTRNRASRP